MKKIFIAVLLMFAGTIYAQEEEKRRFIEVTGSAEQEISPDIIVLSIRLKEFEENKEKISLEMIEKDLMDAFSRSSIEKRNIEVVDITANAITRKRRDREIFAQKTYEVTFNKTSDVLLLLENLKNVKLDFLDIVRLDHTMMEKYRLDLKVVAIKAAAAKADALTGALAAKRGKPLKIIENAPMPFYPGNADGLASNVRYYGSSSPKTDAEGEIALKKIKMRFEIQVTFEIE